MAHLLSFILAALFYTLTLFDVPPQNIRQKAAEKFSRGEKLTYKARYGLLNAATAEVYLYPKYKKINTHTCYQVEIGAKTTGSFAFFYKVNNLYRSFIDTAQIIPLKFHRSVSENKYKLEETVDFDQKQKKVKVYQNKKGEINEKEYKIPKNTQDIVSGYYHLRTINFDKLNKNDTITINGFFESQVYSLKILYFGKKTIKTKFGRIDAVELAPVMPENQLFRGENSVKFWLSDDTNKVPLRIRAKLFVGAFEIDLVSYEGLKTKIGA